MASVFDGTFRSYDLTYVEQTPKLDGGGERVRDPDTGNYLFDETTQTLKVMLKPASSARSGQIREQYGADDKTLALVGRCLDPVSLPDEVRTGTEVDVTIAGKAGSFRVVEAVPSPLAILDELLGEKFTGLWRPS